MFVCVVPCLVYNCGLGEMASVFSIHHGLLPQRRETEAHGVIVPFNMFLPNPHASWRGNRLSKEVKGNYLNQIITDMAQYVFSTTLTKEYSWLAP